MKSSALLADVLIDYRKRRGLSQEELAQTAKLSLRTVQRLEKGQSVPRGYTLQNLSKALDIPIDLLSGADQESGTNLNEPGNSVDPSEETSSYVALMYLSAFSYLLLPGANLLLPLLMRYRKRHNPVIQRAASQLLNFELVWTLVTYGGYFLLLAAQIGLIFYFQIVIVLAPIIFLFVLNLIHAPLLLIGAWKAKKGRYKGYAVGLKLF